MKWLITGCSSGLGLQLARAVANQRDETVIATSRNPSSSPQTVRDLTSNANASWEQLDVSSDYLGEQFAYIIEKHGPIDILVNCAGIAIGGALENTPIEEIRKMYETNFFGVVRLAQGAVHMMRNNGHGTIVNVSSGEARLPHAGAAVYASTKWALEGLSQALAEELRSFNIRVLLAVPGGMRTSFVDPQKMTTAMTPLPEAYKGSMADFVLKALLSENGCQNINPEFAAQMIVEEVLRPTLVMDEDGKEIGKLLRLILGEECVIAAESQLKSMNLELELTRDNAGKCNYKE